MTGGTSSGLNLLAQWHYILYINLYNIIHNTPFLSYNNHLPRNITNYNYDFQCHTLNLQIQSIILRQFGVSSYMKLPATAL